SAILKDIRSRHIIWVWDSVEPLTGFPLGEHAVASDADIHELKAFLAHAVESSVRFVLTSRRSEPELLGGLAAQEVGLMPMTEDEERVVIHQVLAVEAPLRVPETWYPLMVFSGGNPLVLSNITTAVLRRQLVRDEEIKSFLEDARSGALEWDIAGDRRTSVSASLAWGFEAAFIGRDLQRIAVLHLFRSTVFTSVLELMGSSDVDWHVPELRGTSRLEWTDLLGRAERLGVLQGFGSTELYRLHGGTQWFLRKAFLQLDAGMAKAAKRAYAEAIGVFGNMLLPTMQAGGLDTSTLSASIGENFVHARRLALDHGWWLVAIGCMNALKAWFNQPMFSAYWKSLVRETAAYYLNLETLAPHSGLEDYWEAIVQMLVDVAETAEERSFLLERRQHSLDVDLQTFRDANNSRMVSWASDAVRLNRAQVLSERLSQGDLTVREELLRLYEQAQARGPATEAAALAFELGRVALWVQKPPAPSEAVKWYRIAAERCSEPQMKARCLNELGAALRKQSEATADRAEIAALQKAAFAAYREALSVGSENHLERWVAEAHERLGRLHQDCLEFSEALRHFQIALDSHVRQNDDLRVAILQMDIAAVEINTGNFVNAKERLAHALPEFRKRGRADLIEFATETLKRIHASERFS
ncbi:MAG TPA: hypothetical protein VFS23_06350, partial [Vicinamibacterales bacterium]|nr:hypothetical protein [Vicinamibacterales bacterium]